MVDLELLLLLFANIFNVNQRQFGFGLFVQVTLEQDSHVLVSFVCFKSYRILIFDDVVYSLKLNGQISMIFPFPLLVPENYLTVNQCFQLAELYVPVLGFTNSITISLILRSLLNCFQIYWSNWTHINSFLMERPFSSWDQFYLLSKVNGVFKT